VTAIALRDSNRGVIRRSEGVEYLAFLLNGEAYAIQIAAVREILKPAPIAEVPRTDPEIMGVMSVRGLIVTVVDLCAYCTEKKIAPDKRTRILVVQSELGEIVGLAVSQVLEVIRLGSVEIEPPTALGVEPPPHLAGVARPGGGPIVVLIDVPALLGGL
jgi:purine-binding chemotaxis protein CheW